MLQVVAGDEDGSSRFMGIVGEQMLQNQLLGGVEEVERLVEHHGLGTA